MMNFTDFLLAFFTDYHSSYGAIRAGMVDSVRPRNFKEVEREFSNWIRNKDLKLKETNKKTLKSTLYRLRKQGLLDDKGGWCITDDGEARLFDRHAFFTVVAPFKNKNEKQKNTLVIFDVPEKERGKRDWLRAELIILGYEQIQKSVWFGPPLPVEILQYMADRDIIKYLKIFKASPKDLK